MATYVEEKNTKNTGPPKKSLLKMFDIKKIGGLKSILLIIVLLVVAVVLYNFSDITTTTSVEGDGKIGYTTSLEYINQIEKKLSSVLSGIKGAGTVKVMISIDSSPQLEYAENKEEKTTTTSGGSTTVVKTEPIIIDVKGEDSPLILKETLPNINGVIVVSSGANDIKVRLDIVTAVSTALGIDSKIVEVFVGV